MSARIAFRSLRQSTRSLTTTPSRLAEETQSTSTSSIANGFAALSNIFSSAAPTQPSTSDEGFIRAQPVASTSASIRGYQPNALPPKIDPTLDLFTNLLMKHGKKAEAQSRVARILSLM
jgi:small subunit ribosomal protein S7